MKDDLKFFRLWDLYSPLLTEKQREMTDLYFNYDLSLGEIAEQKGISRQSVSDCLAKSRKQLVEYDEKLKFDELLTKGDRAFSAYMTQVNRWIEAQGEPLSEGVRELKTLLAKTLEDCGVEVIEQ
ncbi:MAG: DNA-binding protein [Clostridia bacterium]|nr:DNA-binding protein [Clostridia bacterium]